MFGLYKLAFILVDNLLTFEIIYVSNDDYVEELVVCDVGCSDGHHQVPQPNQRTVVVREHSHDDVVLQIIVNVNNFNLTLKRV